MDNKRQTWITKCRAKKSKIFDPAEQNEVGRLHQAKAEGKVAGAARMGAVRMQKHRLQSQKGLKCSERTLRAN
jgi:hypothetical protein